MNITRRARLLVLAIVVLAIAGVAGVIRLRQSKLQNENQTPTSPANVLHQVQVQRLRPSLPQSRPRQLKYLRLNLGYRQQPHRRLRHPSSMRVLWGR